MVDEASAARLRESASTRSLLRSLTYLRPYRRQVVGACLALVATNVIAILAPQFIRWIVDRGIGQKDQHLLGLSVLSLIMVAFLKGVLTFAHGHWMEVASQSVAYDLRNALHRQLSTLSFSYHDRAETGEILSRAIEDVDRIRFVTGRAFLRLIDGGLLVLGTTAVLIWMNPSLALLSLCVVPLLGWRALYFGRRLRPLSLAIQAQLAVLTTRLEQNLRGARIVKAFAQEMREAERFERENECWFALSERSVRLNAVNGPLLDWIASMGAVFVIVFGGYLVIHDRLTLGELVAFSTYLSQLIQPVRRLGMIVPALALASASGQRVFEILDTVSDVSEAPDARHLPRIEGQVRFEHVSFAYFGRMRVLEDVSFEARPGQVVALLGATGSGKSTVINLIPRFYDPTAGRILIDGQDIRGVSLSTLRDQIGIVLQETVLFASTVRENIAFGRPGASQQEIEAAAVAAQAAEFIREMPDGYDTRVGERGVTLSGGQRQRLAIARALLKDPRILILDDATSSVDSDTEHLIQIALQRLMQGRTSFVIAQRLSTLRTADCILLLERGRLVACGTHNELIRTSGSYAELYTRQLRPEVPGPGVSGRAAGTTGEDGQEE
jgi:ATP-binding cassette subfamily B protein